MLARHGLWIWVFLLAGLPGGIRAEEYWVIPYDVDPPIQVDAVLDDWTGIPNPFVLDRKEQVTYTPEVWEGPADLSGTIRLAYRHDGLFIAAEVTDDVVNQPYRARDIWKGDHVNVWVDLTPGQDPDRQMFGTGQFHFVLSPGNLGGTGGKEKVIPPEIYLYRPEGLPQEGGEIASRRTPTGYVIEAFVPFSRLGVSRGVKRNQDANFELAISEADGSPARQEALMTFDTRKWQYSRKRLLTCVFGDGNGRGTAPARGKPIPGDVVVEPGETVSVSFEADETPAGKEAYVYFKALLQAPAVTGVEPRALRISLNGQPLTAERLSNRNPTSRFFAGDMAEFVAPDGSLGLYLANGFDRPQRSKRYGLMDYGPGCEYEFRAAGMIRPGPNTLTFTSLLPKGAGGPREVRIGEMELRIKTRERPKSVLTGAPEGRLPIHEPQLAFPRTWSGLRWDESTVSFRLRRRRFTVRSRFSAPDGRWYSSSSEFFTHRREVIPRDEWIEVRDTFVNRTDGDVPIMQEHVCEIGTRLQGVWLGGFRQRGLVGRKNDSANPSVYGTTARAGVGMFAHNDEFIVHVETSAGEGALRLADRQYVLAKGATYTATWVIVPVRKPDFWAFVNQARRARGVNFPLEHTFAFMSQPWPIYYWSDEQFRQFIDGKSADLVVLSNNLTRVEGRYPRCTEMYGADLKPYRDFLARLARLYPDGDVKSAVYYHCFLDTTAANAERFSEWRALDEQGQHMNYGGKGAYMKLYLPTTDPGGWGDEIAKWVDLILDDLGADGVFWDEFTRSRGAFVYNHWDGCTADIDPETFKIVRKKGSVTLLSLPFRLRQVKRILGRGAPLVINGAPATRTMVEQRFMAFTETGSMTNCRKMLLHSPVALGDHLTERSEADCYRDMLRALDHGCLYSWYTTRVFPTHKTLTEHMFPFTPIELHSGYVIGK